MGHKASLETQLIGIDLVDILDRFHITARALQGRRHARRGAFPPIDSALNSKGINIRVAMPLVLHPGCYVLRNDLPVDILDEPEHKVGARAHPGGRPDVAIDNPSGPRDPIDLRSPGRNYFPSPFESCGFLAVQESSQRSDSGASTHGHKILEARVLLFDKVDDGVYNCGIRLTHLGRFRVEATHSPRDDENIKLRS